MAKSFEILAPVRRSSPLVFASPHSGSDYPAHFLAASRLDPLTIRFSEDAFVDELFAAAPSLGAPLLLAKFPRSFVDPNREAHELDPDMFEDHLPASANTASPRVACGLGCIPKVIASGEEIYKRKLRFAEAKARINGLYQPYHQALQGLLDETWRLFGCCLLIDCHSMPSLGGPMDSDPGCKRAGMVLGDLFGVSCAPYVTAAVERLLKEMRYKTKRNAPYSGGFTTSHYGHPGRGFHVLQIEINRALYMNEKTMARESGLPLLALNIRRLIEGLTGLDWDKLKPGNP